MIHGKQGNSDILFRVLVQSLVLKLVFLRGNGELKVGEKNDGSNARVRLRCD